MSADSRSRFDIPHDTGFVEVADRCWVARHELADVTVGVIGGSEGLVVVDTHSSAATARAVVEQVRALGAGEVVAVVNTHAHWDHVLGNGTFLAEYDGAQLLAHEDTAAALHEHGTALLDEAGRHTDITGTTVVVPDRTFASASVVDLGDRLVEVVHLGRGHTAGDAIIRVPDADALFAGDLVEESALRNGVPGFGADCFPLEWASTLDLMLGMVGSGSVVVPGHGNPVGQDFVVDQRTSISLVANLIQELAEHGVGPAEMAERAEWPYPVEELRHAFTRGFAQLPRSSRSLPMA